jgi:hypothetical protein
MPVKHWVAVAWVLASTGPLMAQARYELPRERTQFVRWDSLPPCDTAPIPTAEWTELTGTYVPVIIPIPSGFRLYSSDPIRGDEWTDATHSWRVSAFISANDSMSFVFGSPYVSNTVVDNGDSLTFTCDHCFQATSRCVAGLKVVESVGYMSTFSHGRTPQLASARELPGNKWLIVVAMAPERVSLDLIRPSLRYWRLR